MKTPMEKGKCLEKLGQSKEKCGVHIIGKVSDEWFMQLSYKYKTERTELKSEDISVPSKAFGMRTARE